MNVSVLNIRRSVTNPGDSDFLIVGTCEATELGRKVQDRMARSAINYATKTLSVRAMHDEDADTTQIKIIGTAPHERAYFLTTYVRGINITVPD